MTENIANAIVQYMSAALIVTVLALCLTTALVASLRYWRWKWTYLIDHGYAPVVSSSPQWAATTGRRTRK